MINTALFADAAALRRSLIALSAVGGLFTVSVLLFAARCLLQGRIRDAEIDRRGASVLIGNLARTYFAWVMRPAVEALRRSGATPNAVTVASVMPALVSAWLAAVGEFTFAGLAYLFSGACDFLDGRLARETGRSSSGGAALDSVLDRYSECAVLCGLAWFYREGWMPAATLGVITGSLLVPYIRARGEGLGIDVKVGLMQRPERVVLLGLALTFAEPIDWLVGWNDRIPRHLAVVATLAFLAVSTHLTALTRLRYIVRALDERDRAKP